jgi:hypothetical protein
MESTPRFYRLITADGIESNVRPLFGERSYFYTALTCQLPWATAVSVEDCEPFPAREYRLRSVEPLKVANQTVGQVYIYHEVLSKT